MDTADTKPCKSCKNLDLNYKTPAYRLGDFHTFASWAAEAAAAGCPICLVLYWSAQHFCHGASFWDAWCKLDVQLAQPPNNPLSLTCWEMGAITIDFFTTSPLPAPFSQFQLAPTVDKTSEAPECFRKIESWIAECDARHEDCRLAADVRLPNRVVDVNPTPEGLRPFLVETNGASGRYATLSYSWGESLPLRLTKSSLESFKASITWSDIPKTLQDAMRITYRLGLRYIWIDALTIIQDDGADWELEAANMSGIYGNAFITIAATSSRDCQDGIFSTRNLSATHYLAWPLEPGQPPSEVQTLRDGEIYARIDWNRGLDHYPLQKRGWSLQEHILSRRVIQFTSHELVWFCRTGKATEARPTMVEVTRLTHAKKRGWYYPEPAFLPRRDRIDDAATARALSNLWEDIIQNYSRRKLTRDSDKLYAILGVANAFQASGLGRFWAGLCETDLLAGLTWYSSPPGFHEGDWKPTHSRPERYRAPSWSWASIDGAIGWLGKSSDGTDERDYLRSPSAKCNIVRVSDTELVLHGRCITGVLLKNSSRLPPSDAQWSTTSGGKRVRSYSSEDSEIVVGSETDHSVHTDIIDTTPMHPGIGPPAGLPKLPLDVICLLLGDKRSKYNKDVHWAMVLVLARSSARADAYERVGVSGTVEYSLFKGSEMMEVLVI